ncbi:hypothetical protein B0H12DRAFT_1110956 [Mycena haematopus]|nr:hypothetical protein B0H12DRAFT_1110956 [Mycena haematopus]
MRHLARTPARLCSRIAEVRLRLLTCFISVFVFILVLCAFPFRVHIRFRSIGFFWIPSVRA